MEILKKGKYVKNGDKYIQKASLLDILKLYALEIQITLILIVFTIYDFGIICEIDNALFTEIMDVLMVLAIALLVFLTVSQIRYDLRPELSKRYDSIFFLISTILSIFGFSFALMKSYMNLALDIVDLMTFLISLTSSIIVLIMALTNTIIRKMRKRKMHKKGEKPKLSNYIPFMAGMAILAISFIPLTLLMGATTFSGAVQLEWDMVSLIRNLVLIGAFVGFFLFAEWRWDIIFDFEDHLWGYRG